MKSLSPSSFSFGRFRLDTESQILFCDDSAVHLPKRPFSILTYLIENRLRVVSRAELLDNFWDGHDVYDDALRKCVGSIRKALRDDKKPPQFIETRYGGGFRFVADVTALTKNGNGGSNGFSEHPVELNGHALKNGHHSLGAAPISVTRRKVALSLTVGFVLLLGIGLFIFVPRSTISTGISNDPDAAVLIRSVAVMPIKNLTGEQNNDYFSDGMTESIITELSRVAELRVISRTSTFTFKDKDLDPREVGKMLNVDSLLEGSVQGNGDTVHVNVRLVSTRDGTVVWTSNDFERPLTGAFDLQSEIACKVASELKTELCGRDITRKTEDGLAYQEYLKGRFEWNKRTGDGIRKSIEHYEKAVEIDPAYALAYSGLSESYLQGIWHVPFDAKFALPKAKSAALQALNLDKGLAEAHTALAGVYSLEWNWPETDRELRQAIELNPRLARTFHVQAFYFMLMGRYDESIAAIEKAEDLDPLNLVISADKGNLLLSANRFDEAFAQWDKTLTLDPNFVMAHEHRAAAYEWLGNDAAAVVEKVRIMQLNGESPEKIAEFHQIAEKFGMKGIRRRELNELLAKESRGEHVSPIAKAYCYAYLGQSDLVLSSLERAFDEHDPQMVLVSSPPFSNLRSDERFVNLINRVGFAG